MKSSTSGGIRRLGTVLIIATAGLAATVFGPLAGAGATVHTGPSGLAFYHPPKHLPAGHGTLIWARNATGLVPLSSASSTKLVLYTSITPKGKRVAVSGSVSIPKGKPPKRGWPVITYAHGTTGTADVCAPSRNRTGDPVTPYISYVYPRLNDWLKAGYAVVQTDYQGLGTPGPHPYLVGAAEGRGVLDIVRAARQLDPKISSRFLIAGHSQGGQSALFAAGEAKSWVPDLHLHGTVAYAPASHLFEQAEALPGLTNPSPLSALATLIVQGAATASTQVKPNLLLEDPALVFYPQLQTKCLPQLSEPDNLGGIAPADLLRDGADTTALYGVLKKENPAVKTTAPIFLAQGEADTTVFKPFTDLLNTDLTNKGDHVKYVTYPGVTHGEIVNAAEGDVLPWFRQKLPPR